jgi:hypothetical protein
MAEIRTGEGEKRVKQRARLHIQWIKFFWRSEISFLKRVRKLSNLLLIELRKEEGGGREEGKVFAMNFPPSLL